MKATTSTHRPDRIANFRLIVGLMLAIAALALLASPGQLVSALREQPSIKQKTATARSYTATLSSLAPAVACMPAPSGMISWWPGDGNAFDIQGTNSGTLQNGATFAPAEVGQGFSLPASNSSVVVPRNSTLEPAHVTLDAWVKFNSTGTKANIAAKSSNNVRASYGLEIEDDAHLNFFVNTSGGDFRDRQSTTVVSPNVWYHVAGTWDGTTARIYVNGAEEVGTSGPGNGSGNIDYTGALDFEIGNHGGASAFGAINGVVDELHLFDHPLTQTEIASIYNAGSAGTCKSGCTAPPPGMIGWWTGEGSGTVANDIQGTNNGVLEGNTGRIAGMVGQSFSFNPATNDDVRIPNSTSLQPKKFTIDAWVNFNSTVGGGCCNSIFGKALGTGNADSYAVWYMQNALHGLTCANGGSCTVIDYPWIPTPSTWYHVAYTFDGSNHALYVNGRQVATAANTTVPGYDTNDVLIGADTDSSGPLRFDGLIDEVELYNRALSVSEIQNIFHATSAGKCTTPALTIGDVSITPGNSGTSNVVFTVTVDRPNASQITVDYATADGTATQPTDYTLTSGCNSGCTNSSLTIPANTSSATISVPVKGRTRTSSQNFTATLSNQSNAVISRATGACTIQTGNGAQDFSAANNPNGSWSYGYTTAITAGSAFTLDDLYRDDAPFGAPGLEHWYPSGLCGDVTPGVYHNTTGGDLNFGSNTLAPDMLSLHPGCGGQNSVIRWTSPTTGTYVLRGRFQGIDHSGTSTDVHIIKNLGSVATHLLDGNINGYGNELPFILELSVTSGDTFDFIVGIGTDGSYSNDTTALKAEFTAGSLTCASPPSGMISWWPGDSDAKDIKGTNNGTPQNGVTFTTGEVNNAFTFNAASSQYVSVPDAASLHPSSLTIDAWVNFNSTTGTFNSIVGKPLNTGTGDSYGIWYQGGNLRGYTCNNNGCSAILNYGWTPTFGVWYHVAYTFDGNNHTLYLDGRQVATGPNTTVPDYDSHNLFIGGESDNETITGFFDGKIDEVELFDHALLPSEIASIFNAGSAGKCHGKATPALSISNSPVTYNGSPQAATVNGSVSGTVSNVKYDGSSTVPTGAGTYAVTADFTPNDTTNYNSLTGASAGNFVIQKATPTITWSNPADIVYGTVLSATQLNASASVTGASVNPFVYTPASGTALHAGSNQTLHVDFTPQDTTNYNNASKDVHINVTKATLTITADDKQKTYRAANPTLTYTPTGFVNGDTASILTGAPTITTTATTTSVVNTYPITITQNTLSAVHNSFDDYNLNFVNGTLTVNKATPVINWSNPADIVYGTALSATQLNATVTNPNDNSTVGSPVYSPVGGTVLHAGNNQVLAANFTPAGQDANNYNTAVQKTVTINVTKATLTVTADNKGRPFNTANPPLTDTPSGFVNGDTATVLSGAPNLTTTATQSSPVGDYPITITVGTLTAGDYSFNFVNGTLSVGKVVPVISWSNPANIVYGAALSSAQLNATATDPNTSATVSGTFTYSPASGSVLHAGNNQTLTANFAPSDTSNYSAPSQKAVSINVTKATLMITADNKSKTYLAANPSLTYTPSGFVNGDGASVLSGAPALATTATQSSTVNSYSITPSIGTLSAADYSFNFVAGTLTVNKATPEVNWSNPADIVYGTALSATQLNATATNPNDNSTVAGTFTYNPASGTVLNAGNSQVLAANFAPSDASDYNTPVQKTVSINVLSPVGTPTFKAQNAYGAGTGPVRVASADFNGDGKPDLSTLNFSDASVTILLGNGLGQFSVSGTFAIGSAGHTCPTELAVGEFNGDGKPDIATVNGCDANTVTILLNNGNGGFGSPQSFPVGGVGVFAASIKVADFNGDGKLDIAVGSSPIRIFLGNGNGTFQSGASITGTQDQPGPLVVGDFNNDGKVDIARIAAGNLVMVCLNDGTGAFPQSSIKLSSGPASAVTLKAADVNGDGKLDLITGNFLDTGVANNVSVLLGKGDGTFRAPVSYSANGSNEIAVGDLNGDGKPDIVSTGASTYTLDVLLGRGDGAFGQFFSIPLVAGHQAPRGVTLGDFNRNGMLDVASATQDPSNGSNGSTVVFLDDLPPAQTPTGTGVPVREGGVSLNFSGINTAGTTKATPIDPNSAGTLPGGFSISGASLAFDITTTASYTAPVEVCFNVPPVTGETAAQFNARRVMHGENGVLVDRTSRHDFAQHLICANVNSLSPFAIVTNLNPTTTNEIDDTTRFVQQHYFDFLDRQPDTSGLNFWTNNITKCGSNAQCLEVQRINTSASFFLSIEFQQEGFLVERTYKVAYGDATGTSTTGGTHQLPVPIVRFGQFLSDAAEVGQGVVVNQGNWQQQLEDNKNAFMLDFVQRQGFVDAYPTTLTPAEFVDKLFANAGVTPSAADLSTAVGRFSGAANSSDNAARSKALRDVAENSAVVQAEMNRAFVLMEYFGYLRRNPNEGNDMDYSGYDFWLTKLNRFNGNFIEAEMVKAFMNSIEYRQRFGP